MTLYLQIWARTIILSRVLSLWRVTEWTASQAVWVWVLARVIVQETLISLFGELLGQHDKTTETGISYGHGGVGHFGLTVVLTFTTPTDVTDQHKHCNLL